MAWYDEPGDNQSSGYSNYAYDPSGTQSINMPGVGYRPPGEKDFRPQTWLTSPAISRWEEAESILSRRNRELWQEAENLKSLLGMYEGTGDFITQWLIKNSIKSVNSKMADTSQAIGMGQLSLMKARNVEAGTEAREKAMNEYNQAQLKVPWNERGRDMPKTQPSGTWQGMEKWEEMANRSPNQPNAEYEGLEIPDWMTPFLEDSGFGVSREQTPNRGRSQGMQQDFGFGLAPLSAQADLDPEQMGGMQGYLGWSKVGRPDRYNEAYTSGMSGLPQWWEQYVKESQSLFPTSGKGRRSSWSTARQ